MWSGRRLNLVSRASPFTKKEGSGTAPLLELFCWNVINITRAAYFYASLAHCGDKLTAHRACVQQARCAVAHVVHAYIPRSCRSHKICIFMFPRISGEKNNSSNGAVPDPSFFVKGLARETRLNQVGPWPSINIYQSWMRTFAIFGARATQRRCPIASNLGQKYLFSDRSKRRLGWGSHTSAGPLHSIQVETQL